MDQDAATPGGPVRRDDLASILDVADRHGIAPKTVFGEHWPADPLLQRQYALELDGWLDGMGRFRAAVNGARQSQEAGRLSPVRRLIATWVTPVAEAIEEYRTRFLTAKSGRGGGRPPTWLKRTAHLEAQALARTVVEIIIDRVALGRPMPQPALAAAIGQAIEGLHLVAVWQRKNPALLNAYRDRLTAAGATKDHQLTVLRHGFMSKVAGGDEESAASETTLWSIQERTEIGLALIHLANGATGGRISLDAESGQRRPTGKRGRVRSDQKLVTLDAETEAWIGEALSRGELNATSRLPMLAPPRPWRGPSDGGYYLDLGPATRMVVGEHRSAAAVRKALAADPERASPVYRALNKLGQTRWRINHAVLAVAVAARDTGIELPGLPQPATRIEPSRPPDMATNAEARKAWRQAKARMIEANLRHVGHILQAWRVLAEAERLAPEPAFYFPHCCDFRGRMYPMPTVLNIQGGDLARSLLVFADGLPIATDEAAGWLAAHTAKMFGHGKISFADRIAWTHANDAALRRIATDPLGNRQEWAATAGELWQALAAAKEWIAFRDHGPGFVTHLPCFIDGTCNGLQHFAALARDPELARLVNVMPSDGPQDIYQAVADQASVLLAGKCPEGHWLALRWHALLTGKVPRILAKQIVMTKAYGASQKSLMDDVGDLLERLDPQGFAFSSEERPQARAWLAKVMKEAISDRIGSAEQIMVWLQQTAAIVTRYGTDEDGRAAGLQWSVPTGWPWVMAYGAKERRNAHARVGGVRATALVHAESDRVIDKKRQTGSVSPNVIHALDAAALVFALDEMREVTAVAAIHDCIGGRAPEMEVISRAVRTGFAHLYEGFDPLAEIHEAALARIEEAERHRLALPPAVGPMDVRDVIGAEYFFS